MPTTPLKSPRQAANRRRKAPAKRRAPAPAQDGRERILAAAIEAFSEVGYEGASTAGIARAAGVAQPLVHHHFGSKEGLWRAAVDALFSRIPRLPTVADGVPPRVALMQVTEAFVRFVAAHPEVTRIIAREGAAPNPRLTYLLTHYVHEPFREVVDLIRAAQAAGVVAADVRPELCLFLFLGAGSHLFDVRALAQQSQGIDTTSEWTRDNVIRLLRTVLERGLFGGAG
ncbi:MAG: TetR/AcrR family transcriptional regulator [Deltaproteobacteria bacterium]|nr:TetR/AcrR family transcriptional regulator [Deltaproteobacteria bacterium]